MNFDDLVNIVNKSKLKKGEDCLICQFPIHNKTQKIKLQCNHHYHKACLKSTKYHIRCPYCKKISKIHKPIIKIKICNIKIKTGKNKGNVCGRKNCRLHKPINIKNKCYAILKSGKNKGKLCNRIKCKIHNKTIVV